MESEKKIYTEVSIVHQSQDEIEEYNKYNIILDVTLKSSGYRTLLLYNTLKR
jgi:hypothetical protein